MRLSMVGLSRGGGEYAALIAGFGGEEGFDDECEEGGVKLNGIGIGIGRICVVFSKRFDECLGDKLKKKRWGKM